MQYTELRQARNAARRWPKLPGKNTQLYALLRRKGRRRKDEAQEAYAKAQAIGTARRQTKEEEDPLSDFPESAKGSAKKTEARNAYAQAQVDQDGDAIINRFITR